jgi:hypothetical protein
MRDYYEDDEELGREVPIRCKDCDRPAYYDYGDDQYKHAVDPGRGCFLIPPSREEEDRAHPLLEAPATRIEPGRDLSADDAVGEPTS